MARPFTHMKQLMLEKSAKEGKRITYEEIAQATGLAWSTIERYANNRVRRPDFLVVAKLCDYFGVSLDDFISDGAEEDPEMVAVA